MAYKIKERVKDTTTTTGTGDITLAGSAPSGFRTFASAYSTNDLMPYCIEGGGEWEVGIGKLTASTTLQRLAVVDGSDGAATAVDFNAGTKNVFVSPIAGDMSATDPFIFGDGSDGTATISSGVTTLTRDMYYDNLTISGTGRLNPAGFRVHVSEVLDLSNAPAGAISFVPTAGNSATNQNGASGGSLTSAGSLPANEAGNAGANGNTAAGSNSANASASNSLGGGSDAGGPGGTGSSGGGGTAGTGPAANTTLAIRALMQSSWISRGVTGPVGGEGAPGGPGGGGDGTNPGGGGGGGGAGGGFVYVFARILKRDATNTAAAAISSVGGAGGNGFTPATGNCGGGSGGCGAGGGVLQLVTQALAGTAKTNLVSCAGGQGGTGGNGVGSGTAGTGGRGGRGGRAHWFNLATGLLTAVDATATTATAPTNNVVTGTAGAACNITV